MKILNFFVGNFCPSWIWNRIQNAAPDSANQINEDPCRRYGSTTLHTRYPPLKTPAVPEADTANEGSVADPDPKAIKNRTPCPRTIEEQSSALKRIRIPPLIKELERIFFNPRHLL
jgi:hypothetical protein